MPALAKYLESIISVFGNDSTQKIKLVSNYISSDYVGLLKAQNLAPKKEILEKIDKKQFAELITMVANSELTSRAAKDILAMMFEKGGTPGAIATEHGMIQKNDEEELKTLMERIIAENPKVVADYRAGKVVAIMSLVGQGMKLTKGSANPEILKKIALEIIK